MAENLRYMVAYSAYRYNDGSANNAELKEEVEVKSAEEAHKLVERIERAAKLYNDQCNGIHEDDGEDEEDCSYEEREQYLIDHLIGGACGGFFHPGAKAYVDHVRRELLTVPSEGKDAA
jgi:cytochrome c